VKNTIHQHKNRKTVGAATQTLTVVQSQEAELKSNSEIYQDIFSVISFCSKKPESDVSIASKQIAELHEHNENVLSFIVILGLCHL